MPRKTTHRITRAERRKEPFVEPQFVHVSSSAIGSMQSAVMRVGNAILGGDFTGSARGESALDIQVTRDHTYQVASGVEAIALGNYNRASGFGAIAIGSTNDATGDSSVVLGRGGTASAQYAFFAGEDGQATGSEAVAVGVAPQATAIRATAIGSSPTASGQRSVAIGYRATAASNDLVVLAGTVLKLQTAVGVYSTVWHQTNDGSGSGLDADLLDGLDSTAFALALTYASPGSSAVGDTVAAGVATSVSRSDHRHGREAFGAVTAQTSFGASSGNGSATTVSHSDHTHGTPATPVTTATGTTHQVNVSASTGAVTFSTPQDIDTTSSPQFANLKMTAGGHIFPSADSTTAIRIADASGTDFVYFDTTHVRMGINSGGVPATTLAVNTAESNGGVLVTYTGASSGSVGPTFQVGTNDGAAMGSNERIGAFTWNGRDESQSRFGVMMLGLTTEAWDTATSHRGCKVIMYTIANGSTSQVAALTLDQDQTAIFGGDVKIPSGNVLKVNSTQVVSARETGWTAMTNTANKATSYDTTTVTLAQLASRVKSIQDALTTHGLLGA